MAALSLTAFAGLSGVEPSSAHPSLEGLVGVQSEAEIHTIVDSCDPAALLVDVATGKVLAAVQLPEPRMTLDEALRSPGLALGSTCDGPVEFGSSPFVLGWPLLGLYG